MKACCVVSSENLEGLGCNVVLTAGARGEDKDAVVATYLEFGEAKMEAVGDAHNHALSGVAPSNPEGSGITRMAVGLSHASACSMYVGREDGSLEMYSLGLDRELVTIFEGWASAVFPYEGLEESSEFRINGPVTAIALHRPRGAGDDLV